MKPTDFKIGDTFNTATGKWRVTDIGSRVIIAININYIPYDKSWYSGPTYTVAEIVFDEDDLEGLTKDEG